MSRRAPASWTDWQVKKVMEKNNDAVSYSDGAAEQKCATTTGASPKTIAERGRWPCASGIYRGEKGWLGCVAYENAKMVRVPNAKNAKMGGKNTAQNSRKKIEFITNLTKYHSNSLYNCTKNSIGQCNCTTNKAVSAGQWHGALGQSTEKMLRCGAPDGAILEKTQF